MKPIAKYIAFYAGAVVVTAACKFFLGPNPALSGISPVMALALFGGFIARDKDKMFLLPLLALLLSDATIQFLYEQNWFPYAGFYAGQWKNYLLLMTIPLIGGLLGARSRTRIAMSVLAGPTLYFLISNLLVWMNAGEATYTKDWNGLMHCYTMAIPFYRNSLLSTIAFLPMLLITYRNWVAVSAGRTVNAWSQSLIPDSYPISAISSCVALSAAAVASSSHRLLNGFSA